MRQHSKSPHYLTGICGVREVVCRVRQTAVGRLAGRKDGRTDGWVCLTSQRGFVSGQTMSDRPERLSAG